MSRPVEEIVTFTMCNVCSTTGRFLKNIILMKEPEDYYNEEIPIKRIPNDGREELYIEPIDWDDM